MTDIQTWFTFCAGAVSGSCVTMALVLLVWVIRFGSLGPGYPKGNEEASNGKVS